MSSRNLAVIAFAANVVVCGLIGIGLLLVRTPDDQASAAEPKASTSTPTTPPQTTPAPSTPSDSSTPTSTPTTSAPQTSTPNEFQDVSGPGGIGTKIPAGWQAKVRSGASDAQATDPAEPTSFLRYGGSTSPNQPLIEVMRNAERGFSTRYRGYRLIGLRPGTWRQHESVSWEFEFDTPDGRKHVASVYWRAGGLDYVLYASALTTNWPAMKAIYATAYNATAP